MLLLVTTISLTFVSCGGNDDDEPNPEPNVSYGGNDDDEPNLKPNEEDKATIVGKWTIEDYRTGEFTTFEFENNGEYTMLYSFYDRMNKAAGKYQYDPKTQIISFVHFYQDYDFENHGNDPGYGTHLNVKCVLDGSTLTMIGEDCEEFYLTNPVKLKKGAYSGNCPDFKTLLCTMGQYTDKRPDDVLSYETLFEFHNNGRFDYSFNMIVKCDDGTQGYGKVHASGTFSVENYLLDCKFTIVSKEEDNIGRASVFPWDKFTDGEPCEIRFYLALDKSDKVIISTSPIYK